MLDKKHMFHSYKQDLWYWSSSTFGQNEAWHTGSPFPPQKSREGYKSSSFNVRCVRQIGFTEDIIDQQNTFIDPSTGLMWQKKPDGKERNWKNAKRYCESLDLKGFKNWELPSQPVLNMMLSKKDIFDDYKKDGWYWTSTLNSKITLNRSAAMIGFKSKYNGFSPIKDKYLVRCVRNINE